jgi:glycosyltransferase involved in cell wall biosynthesis
MKSKNSTATVVVIPTRNRAELAMTAIRSVLQQPVDNLHVIVSDNSTAEDSRSSLAAFCEQLSDPRLLYTAPPRTLAMSQHWDWAMSQALQLDDAEHFVYLTDRSLFKPGELLKITQFARRYPDKVISYDWVTIFDHQRPITVERQPQTGRLVEVSALRLLFLSSRSIFPRCLPRLMNSCVPRSVIERIQEQFGNIFASISPDYNFCYRCLELVDGIIYYDQAAYVQYDILRSNGAPLMIAVSTDGHKDLLATLELEGVRKCYATSVPYFETAINYMSHEYCLVEKETASHKFPKVRRTQYLVRNAGALLTILAYKLPFSVLRVLSSLRTRARKILSLQWPTIAKNEVSPPFESVRDAIDYAISVSPNGDESAPHLEMLRGSAWS